MPVVETCPVCEWDRCVQAGHRFETVRALVHEGSSDSRRAPCPECVAWADAPLIPKVMGSG
jgi:hypothetical protein